LAVPTNPEINKMYRVLSAYSKLHQEEKEPSTAQRAAHDCHHTRPSEDLLELERKIEQEAVDLVTEQHHLETGIRVFPRKEHVCLFSGLKHDGYPNPLSFQGGEVLSKDESKVILTFFTKFQSDRFRVELNFECKSEFLERYSKRVWP
jgi:hypothetical protein